MDTVISLFVHFCLLSFFAVGGALAMVADMHRFLVIEQHLMTSQQFANAVALAQIAPGPNILFVTLLGLQAAGAWGAVATSVGIMLPSSLITFYAHRLRNRYVEHPLTQSLKLGLAPIAIGLVTSTGIVLAKTADANWLMAFLTVATVLSVAKTKVNPMWLFAIGAMIGIVGIPVVNSSA